MIQNITAPEGAFLLLKFYLTRLKPKKYLYGPVT